MTLWARVYSERRAVLLPVLVLLAVNIGVLLLGVLPLMRAVGTAADEVVGASADLAAARKLEKDVKALRDGKDRAAVETLKFYQEVLPVSYAEALRVTNFWLQGAAAESGLRVGAASLAGRDVFSPQAVNHKRGASRSRARTMAGENAVGRQSCQPASRRATAGSTRAANQAGTKAASRQSRMARAQIEARSAG